MNVLSFLIVGIFVSIGSHASDNFHKQEADRASTSRPVVTLPQVSESPDSQGKVFVDSLDQVSNALQGRTQRGTGENSPSFDALSAIRQR